MIEATYLAGVALAACGATALAVQNIALRVGTDTGRATDAVVVVSGVNVAVLLPIAAVLYYPTYGLTGRAIASFIAAGIAGTLLGRVLFYSSIERIGASRSTPIIASNALIATIIAFFVLGEAVTTIQFLGVVLVVLGVSVISWETSRDQKQVSRRKLAIGLIIPVLAALFYGIEPIFASLGLAEGTPVFVGLTLRTGVGFLGFLLYLRWRGLLPARATLKGANSRWYVLAGLMNTTFLLSYYFALEIAPVGVVYPIIHTNILLVLVLSAVFLSKRLERVTPTLVGAAVFVVLGVIAISLYS